MSDRPHWSYSSINQYLRCPLQYFFQRILGIPSRSISSGLVLGSAVHAGLAEYHRQLKVREAINHDGIADLITSAEESLTVKEFKTSGRAYSSSDVESSLQPTCYVHAVRQTFGKDANVEYTVLVKTKTPKVQRIQTSRYPEDCGRLGDLVETIQRAVDFNVFYPVENAMNCSTCSYRQPCREWGQGSKPESDLVQLAIPQEVALCSLN